MNRWIGVMCVLWIATTAGAADSGVTVWALGGPGEQQLRVGYEGLLPTVEIAVAAGHLDAPDDGIDRWPLRLYGIAHTLDANMVGNLLGGSVKLPPGNAYLGLFGQYEFDRAEEISGGWCVGGVVDWPKGWQSVAEYSQQVWNTDRYGATFLVGLRKRF